MYVSNYISTHKPDEFAAFLKRENVGRLFVFGSSLFSKNPNDIDLLIESGHTDPLEKGESLLTLWDYFEEYFQKKVDLLTPRSLNNPFLKEEVEKTKKLIYANEKQPSLLV